MDIFSKKKYFFLILLLISFGVFFRFYSLNWGAPYYFHPDERNIASSISQLSYPSQMNPHFFAYGSLPIYCIYFIGVLSNLLHKFLFHSSGVVTTVSFEYAIVIGRIVSASLSAVLLYLIYALGYEIGEKKTAFYSLVLSLFSVGFIQYAHFSTFEMWLSFFTTLLCYLTVMYTKSRSRKYILYSAFIVGILISIKISSIVFLPLILGCLLIIDLLDLKRIRQKKIIHFEKVVLDIIVFISISLLVIILTSPFFWTGNSDFQSSIRYESTVALGSLPVFYTQIFNASQPGIYQFIKVFPFILNPFVFFSFIISFLSIVKDFLQKKQLNLVIITIFLLIGLFSQIFLFVKWIRYYIPILPFIYIFLGYFLAHLVKAKYSLVVFSILVIISFLYTFSYFKTVLTKTDTRIEAATWASRHIPKSSHIISEVYDLGIVPFNQYFGSITLFNFYNLDVDDIKREELKKLESESDYVIIPSQRVVVSRISQPNLYPNGNLFYKSLLFRSSKFKKIYETPCDLLCRILYLGDPVNSFEQTANVFDRPTVMIFKKTEK